MSQISPFEESQLFRIKTFKSALLKTITESASTCNPSESSYLNQINDRITKIHHNLPFLASKLPGMPLSKRVIQHKVATSFHPRSNTTRDHKNESFLGLSGAAVDRMSDLTPNLVLTLTPNDTLRLEGTLTATTKFEFPTTSLISKALIDNVNQRR